MNNNLGPNELDYDANTIDLLKKIMIISWNEGTAIIKDTNMYQHDVLNKILLERPIIIFVCTQESQASGDKHYQHVLGELS